MNTRPHCARRTVVGDTARRAVRCRNGLGEPGETLCVPVRQSSPKPPGKSLILLEHGGSLGSANDFSHLATRWRLAGGVSPTFLQWTVLIGLKPVRLAGR